MPAPLSRPPAIEIVALVGTTGSATAMRDVLSQLPSTFTRPIVCLSPLAGAWAGELLAMLRGWSALRVERAASGHRPAAGTACLCTPGWLLGEHAEGGAFVAGSAQEEPDANGFLHSIAATFGERAAVVVLGEATHELRPGLAALRASHATLLVQRRVEGRARSSEPVMDVESVEAAVELQAIAPLLVSLTRGCRPLALLCESATSLLYGRLEPERIHALRFLLSRALQLCGADLGNVQFYEPNSGTLRIVAQRGFALDFLDYFRVVDAADGTACGRALREGSPIRIDDVSLDSEFAPHFHIARAAGFSAVQSIPLLGDDGALHGVMSTHFRNRRRFEPADLRALEGTIESAAGVLA